MRYCFSYETRKPKNAGSGLCQSAQTSQRNESHLLRQAKLETVVYADCAREHQARKAIKMNTAIYFAGVSICIIGLALIHPGLALLTIGTLLIYSSKT